MCTKLKKNKIVEIRIPLFSFPAMLTSFIPFTKETAVITATLAYQGP